AISPRLATSTLRNILDPFSLPVTKTIVSVARPVRHVNRATHRRRSPSSAPVAGCRGGVRNRRGGPRRDGFPSRPPGAAAQWAAGYSVIFRSLFGVPSPGLPILSAVAPSVRAVATASGVASGWPARYTAAAPATWGLAIEVPDIVLVPWSLSFQAEVMSEPGAYRSTTEPKLEKSDWASSLVLEATVRASGTRAGEPWPASADSLPAATAKVTPEAMALATAASRAGSAAPPRLMLATEGPWWFSVTQSMPAMTCSVVPEPLSSRTLTATMPAFLATPCAAPAMVAATWVPWPLPSSAVSSSSTASYPWLARPSKSSWVTRTPVSMT